MTEQALQQYLIKQYPKEDEGCEWKEFKNLKNDFSGHEKDDVISYVSALANMEGGHLVVGVEDKTLKIVGTDTYNYTTQQATLRLTNLCANLSSEGLDIEEFITEDTHKIVWVIHIPKHLPKLPVYAHNKAWQRIEDSLVELTPERLNAILEEQLFAPDDWSAGIVENATLADLDELAVAKARVMYKKVHSKIPANEIDGWSVEELLSAETYFDMMRLPLLSDTMGIIDRMLAEKIVIQDEVGYSITELGALLFAKHLSDFDDLRRKMVRVIVYKGKSKLDIVREQSFDAGYAISFKTMVEWINSQLPANEEIGQALRSTVTMYPEIAVREIVANMLVHQDFSEKGFPMVEIYTDRIDVSNPGQPIISVERFIDEYNSRNSSLADLMRRLGICEELGSGLDKAVAAIELFQLPPLRFTVQEARTTVTLFAYRKYADLDRQERIYACYQHACLKYVTNDKMTNLTLRERLGIDKQNYPMASRIIKDTLIAGKIKEEKTENQSRNNKGYVPFWA